MIPTLDPAKVALFQHLNRTPPTPWAGASPYDWAESVQAGLGSLYGLSRTPLSRSALRALWTNPAVSVETCFLSTMAWGGMQRGNGRRIWTARTNCLAICADVRVGLHTPASGFQAFSTLRSMKRLPDWAQPTSPRSCSSRCQRRTATSWINGQLGAFIF